MNIEIADEYDEVKYSRCQVFLLVLTLKPYKNN